MKGAVKVESRARLGLAGDAAGACVAHGDVAGAGGAGAGAAGAVADELRDGFQGRLFLPADDGYDEQRAAQGPGLDSRPLLVAEAARPADVRAAVAAARRHGIPLAVQSTGHETLVPRQRSAMCPSPGAWCRTRPVR